MNVVYQDLNTNYYYARTNLFW